MKKTGCWIFLSHSSEDIEKVRKIRNAFEERGHNPLAFHLLCLKADTKQGRDELDSLIKREIDAREWFIFCESNAAKTSEYVAMEKEYIVATGKKKIWSIDMGLEMDDILTIVDDICRQLKIFISYNRADRIISELLSNELMKKDFDVWTDRDLMVGDNWINTISSEIEQAQRYGFCILIISVRYFESQFCMNELQTILETGENMVPLLVGNTAIPECLKKYRCYRIPDAKDFSSQDALLVAELIESETKLRIKGPTNQDDVWTKISQIQERLKP